jgi:hypothetical protein
MHSVSDLLLLGMDGTLSNHCSCLMFHVSFPLSSSHSASPPRAPAARSPPCAQVMMAGVLLDVMRAANEEHGGIVPYSGGEGRGGEGMGWDGLKWR